MHLWLPDVSKTLFILQRSVMEDPKCMPINMHPYILAMTGFGHTYTRHNTYDVPAE